MIWRFSDVVVDSIWFKPASLETIVKNAAKGNGESLSNSDLRLQKSE